VDKRPAPTIEAESDPEVRREEEGWLLCVDCGHRIAPLRAATSVTGAHQHELVNPSAIVFVVRCFTHAPGCMPVGERSTQWTWFPGYAWQIELCRGCAGHVGWSFHATGKSAFYGLIRDRVLEA
jgi:hypothetical protein